MMGKVPYVCKKQQYENHFMGQIGGGNEYFSGQAIQEGYGLGNVLASMVKQALPLIVKHGKPIAKRGAKELLKSGTNVVKDVVIDKKKPMTSIKSRGKDSIKSFLTQKGKGIRKRKPKTKICKSKLKKDIFG